MTITQEELGQRLKTARETSGLTQQEVADALDIQRTSLISIESGKRAVSSIELDKLSRIYRRDMSEFFEQAFEEDPTHVLLRTVSTTEIPVGSINKDELLKCANLCRHITFLEELLELPVSPIGPVTYALRQPSSRWNAVQQGMSLAEQERKRLGLGIWPVQNLAEIIRRQGVRVIEHAMSEDISGLFFHGRKLGLAVVINAAHKHQRKLFSFAHEYCHVLVDRNRPSLISHV
ncbi:MAG: helix-turn-helix domain-containing protein [Candidatus Obscuribacterales bacterium]|nr:helix-turn-helix domain-containing protein [Candidatus Obscuribacterales bacterium]